MKLTPLQRVRRRIKLRIIRNNFSRGVLLPRVSRKTWLRVKALQHRATTHRFTHVFSNPHRYGPPKPSSIRGKSAYVIIDDFPVFTYDEITQDDLGPLDPNNPLSDMLDKVHECLALPPEFGQGNKQIAAGAVRGATAPRPCKLPRYHLVPKKEK